MPVFLGVLQFRSFKHPGLPPQRELHIYPYTCKRFISLQIYIHRICPNGIQWEDSSSSWGTPPNAICFHCKVDFIIVLCQRSWGVPLGELEKLILYIRSTKKWIVLGGLLFQRKVPVQKLQTSRIATSQREFHLCHDRPYYIYIQIHVASPRFHKVRNIPIISLQPHIHRIWYL